jgi:hypothetical protein
MLSHQGGIHWGRPIGITSTHSRQAKSSPRSKFAPISGVSAARYSPRPQRERRVHRAPCGSASIVTSTPSAPLAAQRMVRGWPERPPWTSASKTGGPRTRRGMPEHAIAHARCPELSVLQTLCPAACPLTAPRRCRTACYCRWHESWNLLCTG